MKMKSAVLAKFARIRRDEIKPNIVDWRLKHYRPQSVESLVDLLTSDGVGVNDRVAICIALGEIGTAQAKEGLGYVFSKPIISDFDGAHLIQAAAVRLAAGEILVKLGPPAPDSLIEGLVRVIDLGVREEIEGLIVEIGGSSTVEALADAVDDQNSEKIRRRLRTVMHRTRKAAQAQEKKRHITFDEAFPGTFDEVFPAAFLRKYTDFASVEAMLEATGFAVESLEDLESIAGAEWDTFISSNTEFSSWEEMKWRAFIEWIAREAEL